MNNSRIKEIIQKKLNERDMNISTLERQAGLAANTIRRTLLSDNPNPTLETLMSLAEVFNCSLDELTGKERVGLIIPSGLFIEGMLWNQSLFENIVLNTLEHLKKANHSINFFSIQTLIIDTYNYCMVNKEGQFESSFLDWNLKKIISTSTRTSTKTVVQNNITNNIVSNTS